MFKHYLEGIENVAIWPMVSFAIFFIFFIVLLLYVFTVDKDFIKKMKDLPLEDDSDEVNSTKGFGKSISKYKNYALTVLLVLLANVGNAQSTASSGMSQEAIVLIVLIFVVIVSLVVLVVAITIYRLFKIVVIDEKSRKLVALAEKTGVPVTQLEEHQEESWWKQLWWKGLNDSVSVEEEASIMLDHDYDGIKELDNHLPPWWKYSFYMSIVFAIAYMFIYHVFESAPLQLEEYKAQMTLAAEEASARTSSGTSNDINENNVVFIDDSDVLSEAKTVYERTCGPCHKNDGGGSVGPNLTDEFWIHGGSINDIFKTIKFGVPDKGMVSWEKVLTPTQISGVSIYILTLQGTNPAGAKAAQGDKYVPEAAASAEELEADTVSVVNE